MKLKIFGKDRDKNKRSFFWFEFDNVRLMLGDLFGLVFGLFQVC